MNRALRNLLLAGTAVAVPAVANAMIAARAGRMPASLSGDIAYYDWTYGREIGRAHV